jgi:hypothetical protein
VESLLAFNNDEWQLHAFIATAFDIGTFRLAWLVLHFMDVIIHHIEQDIRNLLQCAGLPRTVQLLRWRPWYSEEQAGLALRRSHEPRCIQNITQWMIQVIDTIPLLHFHRMVFLG